MGRITRDLVERIRGLLSAIKQTICIVFSHLTESNHPVNVTETFCSAYIVSSGYSRVFKCLVFSVVDAVGIRLYNGLATKAPMVHSPLNEQGTVILKNPPFRSIIRSQSHEFTLSFVPIWTHTFRPTNLLPYPS